MKSIKLGTPVFLAVVLIAFGSMGNAYAQSDSNGGGKKRGGPPQEAFDACASLVENDSCSVETPKGTMEGSCMVSPREEQLVCAPAR